MVRISFSINPWNHTETLNHSDGKEVKVVTQQTATDVDQVKSSSSNLISSDSGALPTSQGTNCGKVSTDGSPHRIPQRTITSHAILITRNRHRGSFEAASFRSGRRKAHFFGFTENVCSAPFPT